MLKEGVLHLWGEGDPKNAGAAALKRTEEPVQPEGSGASEEEGTTGRPRYLGVRHYVFLGVVLTATAFAAAGLLTDWQAFFLNAGVIASIASAATIIASFLMIRYSYHAIRYRGMMLSISALTVLL